MQQSQFLLVVCSMWQRMQSFNKCLLSCRSTLNSSNFSDALSQLSVSDVEKAAQHILNEEETNNPTLKKLFKHIHAHSSSLGHTNEAASQARHRLFHCGTTLELQLCSLQLLLVMNVFLE